MFLLAAAVAISLVHLSLSQSCHLPIISGPSVYGEMLLVLLLLLMVCYSSFSFHFFSLALLSYFLSFSFSNRIVVDVCGLLLVVKGGKECLCCPAW